MDKQVENLQTMRKASDTIKSSKQNVLDHVGIMKDQQAKLIKRLQDVVSDIRVHLEETLE